MPLTPEQQQELAELRRLEELEKKYGQSQPQNSFMDRLSDSYNKFTGSQPGDTAIDAAKRAIRPINSPADMSPMERMAFESGQGEAAKAAGEPLAKLAGMLGRGITKGGDYLMQKAAGIKRYIPGVGETMANEGVVGTRGMMRKQVANALEETGQKIGSLAESVPEVSTQPVAEKLGERAAKLVGPDGEVLPDNMKAFRGYVDAANKASTEGSVSGEVAAARRSQYGKIARDAGRYRENPAQGLKSQLAGDQQAGYSEMLKGASPEMAGADKIYSDLSAADQAMARPESMTPFSVAGKAVLPALGAAVGGMPGAAVGLAAETPLAQSLAGQGLVKTGHLATKVAPAAKYVPMTLKELLNIKENE